MPEYEGVSEVMPSKVEGETGPSLAALIRPEGNFFLKLSPIRANMGADSQGDTEKPWLIKREDDFIETTLAKPRKSGVFRRAIQFKKSRPSSRSNSRVATLERAIRTPKIGSVRSGQIVKPSRNEWERNNRNTGRAGRVGSIEGTSRIQNSERGRRKKKNNRKALQINNKNDINDVLAGVSVTSEAGSKKSTIKSNNHSPKVRASPSKDTLRDPGIDHRKSDDQFQYQQSEAIFESPRSGISLSNYVKNSEQYDSDNQSMFDDPPNAFRSHSYSPSQSPTHSHRSRLNGSSKNRNNALNDRIKKNKDNLSNLDSDGSQSHKDNDMSRPNRGAMLGAEGRRPNRRFRNGLIKTMPALTSIALVLTGQGSSGGFGGGSDAEMYGEDRFGGGGGFEGGGVRFSRNGGRNTDGIRNSEELVDNGYDDEIDSELSDYGDKVNPSDRDVINDDSDTHPPRKITGKKNKNYNNAGGGSGKRASKEIKSEIGNKSKEVLNVSESSTPQNNSSNGLKYDTDHVGHDRDSENSPTGKFEVHDDKKNGTSTEDNSYDKSGSLNGVENSSD